MRNRAADTAGAAGYDRDSSCERLGCGLSAQLGLLQGPILDVEGFLLGQAEIFIDGARASNDAYRVAVELGRDACGRLVRCEAEHADRWHQDHHRVRIAHLRSAESAASFVVGLVFTPVAGNRFGRSRFYSGGIGRQHEWPNLGAKKMIRAQGPDAGKLLKPPGPHELEYFRIVGEMTDFVLRGR